MFDDYNLIKTNDEPSQIDMGPLIDMVFILLIFFIITTNFNRQTGIDVTKPKAATASSSKARVVMVGITPEGTIHVFGRQVSPERLLAIVKTEVTKDAETSVIIVADEKAPIGKAVQIMDQCSLAGARQVSIAADQEG